MPSIEDSFYTYQELAKIPVQDNGAPMVPIPPGPVLTYVLDQDMRAYTGDSIYVRSSVLDRLYCAQEHIGSFWSGARIEVVYGYRAISIQRALFDRVAQDLCAQSPDLDQDQIKARAHIFIAEPSVAGHPTGGAVDVRLRGADGSLIPMGTEIWTFHTDSYVHAPHLGRDVWRHRQGLRHAMVRAGFAPFDGEWWHFSYGDREWAAHYRRPRALYQSIAFRAPQT